MDNDNEFLEEMENDKYVNQIEIDKKQEIEDKKQDKIDKKQNKINSKITKEQKMEDKQRKIEEKNKEKQEKINESTETEIIGKTKRSLINKINKYKKLFKTELSDYRINKNASEDELKNHITNIQDLLDSTQVDEYINDSIYHCIKMIEPLTCNSKRYNITGLSTMLKMNPQFDSMCKKLMLKYNCFLQTPIEYQFLMCISTTIYLTIQMNQSKPTLNEFLIGLQMHSY